MAKKPKSNLKRVRQNLKSRARNRIRKLKLRQALKEIRSETNKERALSLIPKVTGIIDRSAHIGIIHKNTAARLKSRIAARIAKIK